MNLDEGKFYIKTVELEGIYNFVVHSIFCLSTSSYLNNWNNVQIHIKIDYTSHVYL